MRKGHVTKEGGGNFPLESSWNNLVGEKEKGGKEKEKKKREKERKRKERRRKEE